MRNKSELPVGHKDKKEPPRRGKQSSKRFVEESMLEEELLAKEVNDHVHEVDEDYEAYKEAMYDYAQAAEEY